MPKISTEGLRGHQEKIDRQKLNTTKEYYIDKNGEEKESNVASSSLRANKKIEYYNNYGLHIDVQKNVAHIVSEEN